MTGEAERLWSGSDELDAGYIFIGTDLVAARTAHRDGGVDELPLALVVMTLDAFRRIGLGVQRDGVNRAQQVHTAQQCQAHDEDDSQRQTSWRRTSPHLAWQH